MCCSVLFFRCASICGEKVCQVVLLSLLKLTLICYLYFGFGSMHFVLFILHWACCQYRWFYIFVVLKVNWWFQYTSGYLVHCYLEMQMGILKMCRDISLNLFVIHDIFIVYFFVIWILFGVTNRISVYLLFNWVLYLYFCTLCFVLELCIWYWKVQTWYLLLCWMRLYTDLCNWVLTGYLFCFMPLSRRVILFCDIQVTNFHFPLFRRRICRNRVILGVLKNGVLGVLPKFCTFQKLDYFILSQVHILRLAIFQWVLYLTFVYFTVRSEECCFIYFCILIFIFVITFYLLFRYYLICFDLYLFYDICWQVYTSYLYLLFSFSLSCFTGIFCCVLYGCSHLDLLLFFFEFSVHLSLCFCFCVVSAIGIFTLNFAWFYVIVLKDMLVCYLLFCALVCISIYWLSTCFQYILWFVFFVFAVIYYLLFVFVLCFNLCFWFDSCLFLLNNFIGFVFYSSALCSVLLYSVDLFALLLFWFFCCFYLFYLECIFSGLFRVFMHCRVFILYYLLWMKTLTLRFINSVLFMFCNLNWFFVCEGGYYISDIDHKSASQRGILQAVYFIAIPV